MRASTTPRPLLLLAGLMVMLVAPSQAAAALRSPQLESRCADGYSYGEERVGPFIVEGCNREGSPEGEEDSRRLFKGTVEVNGLLIEPAEGDNPLVATTNRVREGSLSFNNGYLDRSASTRVVLDPLIAGQRRRIVLKTGPLHLDGTSTNESITPGDYTELVGGPLTVGSATLARYESTDSIRGGGVVDPDSDERATRHDIGRKLGTTSLGIGGSPALLGLRIAGLEDVTLGQSGARFKMELKLGAAAPALMRDFVGKATIELDDGRGMLVDDLRFRLGYLGIPGVGGLDNFRINYDRDRDEWRGGFLLQLTEPLPDLDFSASVNATNGTPTSMRLAIEPLTIPLGPTGIILDGVRAGFQLDPLILEGGVGLSAGPRIGSYAVLEADADLSLQIDPNFRFETVGSLRVLPTSASNQLARGDVTFILDSTGLIALRGNARFEATAAGVGISARIGGSGAYSTSASVFNIGASATGNLELGFLGSAQIAQLKAVISSDGFGTCGKLFSFISAGVGQNWRRGRLKLMTSCNLGPYRVNVANASQARRMQAGVRSTPFTVPAGVDQVAVEVRGKQRGVAMRLFGPGDKLIANIPAGTREVGNDLVAFSARDGVATDVVESDGDSAGPITAYLFLRKPAAGRYTLRTLPASPEISQVRVATDADAVDPVQSAEVEERRSGAAGGRRMKVKVRGLSGTSDSVQFGLERPGGPTVPIGPPVTGDASLDFSDVSEPRDQRIVAQVLRDGIPLPGRRADVGRYRGFAPKIDRKVKVKRDGRRLQVTAKLSRGSARVQAFEYRISMGARKGVFQRSVGKSLKLWLPKASGKLTIEIHPVVGGKALERIKRKVRVR